MHPVFAKTFGGLSGAYYFRQLFFGFLLAWFVYAMVSLSHTPPGLSTWGMLAVNTLLYPYARFVYESVVGFIVGDNAFLVDGLLFVAIKTVTMVMCWTLALLIAPIGLAYLYFHHSGSSD